jgi:hypothetical protein
LCRYDLLGAGIGELHCLPRWIVQPRAVFKLHALSGWNVLVLWHPVSVVSSRYIRPYCRILDMHGLPGKLCRWGITMHYAAYGRADTSAERRPDSAAHRTTHVTTGLTADKSAVVAAVPTADETAH